MMDMIVISEGMRCAPAPADLQVFLPYVVEAGTRARVNGSGC